MSNQKQKQELVEEEIKEETIPQEEIKEETKEQSLIKKDDVLLIISSAKARASRLAQTSISMSCREVLAMLNGIRDSVEKL